LKDERYESRTTANLFFMPKIDYIREEIIGSASQTLILLDVKILKF
jgi:hypothetical protein